MTVSLKSVVISVPSCYLWDSNFYPFLSTARLVLAVTPTPPAHSSSRRTCCTLLWKPLSSHAVSIPLILPWYPHPLLRHPLHHPYAWRILGKWSVFCQWFWSVSSYTGRAETRMCVPWWGNKRGFRMPVLDIVITQYLDSSYRGSPGQRPGTVPEYGTCWALMWTRPFFKYPRQNLGTGSVRVQCFCLVPGQSTALYSLLCSSFKVASDKAKAGD